MEKTVHQGRNIKRFREMFGIKQEALAIELGDDWNQKKISLLEAKETIDDKLLEQVAKVLKVPSEAIKNFDENAAVNFISSTFNNTSHDNSTFNAMNINPTFNVFDKFIEQVEKNEKLYEALLKSEREKIVLLEKK